jgi:ParB family transcriptional regulator, chromosome partitioning protein
MSKPTDTQRKALGKGLSALLPQRQSATAHAPSRQAAAPAAESPQLRAEKLEAHTLPVHSIQPNPFQPRQDFDETRIRELAQSITANGVIQPITVCKMGDSYAIVAGERRWRAAKIAGLAEIPVYVRNVDQNKILELALIENIQREDLNPVETAQAFEQLIGKYQLTHEQIAERTGKDRSTITNFLRLLKLPQMVLENLIAGTISMGHARALAGLPDQPSQIETCEKVVAAGLSVRDTEQLVKRLTSSAAVPAAKQEKEKQSVDPNTRAAIEQMSMSLGTKVKIHPRSEKSGRLEIEYYSLDDLQRIFEVIVHDGR